MSGGRAELFEPVSSCTLAATRFSLLANTLGTMTRAGAGDVDTVELELQRCYVERQRLFWRWSHENETDPFGSMARRWERQEERRRLERRIRELEALKRLERANLAHRIDAVGLAKRLLRLVGEEGDGGD